MRTALENIQEGDLIILYSGGWHSRRSVVKADHVSKTLIHAGGYRFNRKTGRRTGGDWRRESIQVPVDGEIQEVHDENEARRLVNQLSAVKWSECDLITLRAAAALFPKPATGEVR